MLLNDDQMMLGFRSPENVDENMLKELKKFFRNRKCAYYAKLILLTIYNKETLEPLEPEHYCVILSPTPKFSLDKDNFKIFSIMKPYLPDDGFVDFSVLGYFCTMQIYDEGKGLMIYE